MRSSREIAAKDGAAGGPAPATPHDLVLANMGLAGAAVRKWLRSGIDPDDLRQIAMEALCRAAIRYDARKGKFSSYACPTIERALMRASRVEQGWRRRAVLDEPLGPDADESVITTLPSREAPPDATTALRGFDRAARVAGTDRTRAIARAVLDLRLLADEPETLEEVGEPFGVSRERVRQVERRVRARLLDLEAA